MTRKSKTRYGMARTYRIAPTVKILRAAILASTLLTPFGIVSAAPAFATGISIIDFTDVLINNVDDYTVVAGFEAIGIEGISYNGDVFIDNAGDLVVYANGYYGTSNAYGIVSSAYGESHVTNSGNINITAHASTDGFYSAEAQGIKSFAITGDSIVTNEGAIHIDVSSASSIITFGINANSRLGDVDVYNTAEIIIVAGGGGSAWGSGINISTSSDGYASLENLGDIDIDVTGYSAFMDGIKGYSFDGVVDVTNSGDIALDATVVEDVNISALTALTANSYSAYGGIVKIVNNGDIHLSTLQTGETRPGSTQVEGILAFGYTIANIFNNGDITVVSESESYGSVAAYGIVASSQTITGLVNEGTISISAYAHVGGVRVIGLQSAGGRDNYLSNSGEISIIAESDNGSAEASGIIIAGGRNYNLFRNDGDVSVSATSNSGSAWAKGLWEFSLGETSGSNTGSVVVSSESLQSSSYAVGIHIESMAYSWDSSFSNLGDLTVESKGLIQAWAFGIHADTDGDSLISNGGDITVSAISDCECSYAYGISVENTRGDIAMLNSGLIQVDSTGTSIGILANAMATSVETCNYYCYITMYGGFVSIANEGVIDVNGATNVVGINAISENSSVLILNKGDISATSSSGSAVGISVTSLTEAYIINEGSIQALGDNALAISVEGAGITIKNTGLIFGSILADDGDDNINNAVGGSMYMDNSSIDLGGGENAFINNGKLFSNGDENVISIGAGNLFTNNGNSIHMNDGNANDVLTVVGNFSGTGGVFVDVDGASLSSDQLIIDGNVNAGTANTITINMVSPVSFSDIANGEEITIVSVSGTSQASNFVLNSNIGGVNGLYKFEYFLNYNQGDYSLAFDFGLSDLGTLATTLSPAIQNIWYNSIGTVYQREGSARSFLSEGEDSGGGVWARVYGTDGSNKPDAAKNNFGGGSTNSDFEMSGIALDAGIGYAFNQQFVAGITLGTSDTDIDAAVGGKATVSATSFGAYVSYLPGNGFYGDLSYRWMDFDGDGSVSVDRIDYQGKAYGFSLEFGYAFKTESGFEIEPQLQYSDMTVDMDNIVYNDTEFQLNDGGSSQLRAGLALRKEYSADWGKWTPYGALSYVDLSGGSNNYNISGVLEGDVDMSGSSGLLELGITAIAGDWIFAGGLNWQNGGAFDSVLSGQLNVKYIW